MGDLFAAWKGVGHNTPTNGQPAVSAIAAGESAPGPL